jgi:glycosyltransferase 2 family protein
MSSSSRRRLGLALRVAFGLAGAAFLVIAFLHTWDRSAEVVAVSWWRLAAALALGAIALALMFWAWHALVGGGPRRALAWGFYVSQLGKYVPGGVWQAAGQIGYAARAGGTLSGASTAYAVFAVTQAAAGGLLALTLGAFHLELAVPLRLGLLAAGGLVLLLHRRWMVGAVRLVRRVLRREVTDALVPAQRAILASWLWMVAALAASGAAYALLLGGLGVPGFPVAAVPALAFAWVVGFLALPVPSGIGVREAVLLATLAPLAPIPALIAASVYHRLVMMSAEVVMIGAARWMPWPAGQRSSKDLAADGNQQAP